MSDSLTEPSLLGRLLGDRYEIRARLGHGGMGEVFEAVDRRLGRSVAIKVLRPELAADERFLARFRREAATAAGLAHAGIVSVHDIGEQAGRTFIVMELVAGRTIADIVMTTRALDVTRVARIGSAAARALAHAHDRGVVHRDVSPVNIMVTADDAVKILDFGIARGRSDAMRSTATSRGTLAFLAPEVLRGSPVDARADVFALGVTLRELAQVVDAPHAGLDGIIDRAAAADPGARFMTAAAFADALDELHGTLMPDFAQQAFDATHRTGSGTEPIVRVATRPLATSARSDAEPARGLALEPARGVALDPARGVALGPARGVALGPARGLATAPGRRRSRGGRVVRAAVAAALVGIALGGTVVVGQALVSMSAPRVPDPVVGAVALAPPRDLATAASCDGMFSTGVDLTWTASAPADGYEIRRREGDDRSVLVARVRGASAEAFRDTDLGVDTAYAYRVRAFDGPRVSRWSNVVEVATPLLCLT